MKYDPANVSIIICCRKEGEGIERIIQSLDGYGQEIIVVDGNSNDGTEVIAKKYGARFYLDNKKGRGDAAKIGIAKAKGEIIVFFDADGSHEATDIPALVAPLRANQAEMVVGSRIMGGCLDADLASLGGIVRMAGTNFMVYLVNRRFKTNLTDILYSFRALKTETARSLKLEADNFAIEQDMVVRCLKQKRRIIEVPSREKARGWGVSKLKTSMGIELLRVLIRDLYFKS